MKLKDFEKICTSLYTRYFFEDSKGRFLDGVTKNFEDTDEYAEAITKINHYIKNFECEVTEIFNDTTDRFLTIYVRTNK